MAAKELPHHCFWKFQFNDIHKKDKNKYALLTEVDNTRYNDEKGRENDKQKISAG